MYRLYGIVKHTDDFYGDVELLDDTGELFFSMEEFEKKTKTRPKYYGHKWRLMPETDNIIDIDLTTKHLIM